MAERRERYRAPWRVMVSRARTDRRPGFRHSSAQWPIWGRSSHIELGEFLRAGMARRDRHCCD